MKKLNWSPERKIVGSAIAVLIMAVLTLLTDTELAPGIEGAVAIVVAYFLPNQRGPSNEE